MLFSGFGATNHIIEGENLDKIIEIGFESELGDLDSQNSCSFGVDDLETAASTPEYIFTFANASACFT